MEFDIEENEEIIKNFIDYIHQNNFNKLHLYIDLPIPKEIYYDLVKVGGYTIYFGVEDNEYTDIKYNAYIENCFKLFGKYVMIYACYYYDCYCYYDMFSNRFILTKSKIINHIYPNVIKSYDFLYEVYQDLIINEYDLKKLI